ncbi:MAG TPA: hypothetical protein VFQ48_05710 [Pseudonocardiaceae bacterium]|nr:hypothetical protein [Pseudonocardiaceae bacterium]
MTGTVRAVCRHAMPCSVQVHTRPEPPDPGNLCEVCAVRDDPLLVLPPVFGPDRRPG